LSVCQQKPSQRRGRWSAPVWPWRSQGGQSWRTATPRRWCSSAGKEVVALAGIYTNTMEIFAEGTGVHNERQSGICTALDWPDTGRGCKGHSKNKVTDPYVYLINFRVTNNPKILFFFTFFFSTFLGVSRWGEFKNTILKKKQKAHVKNFSRENSQKIDKNFDVSFSSIFFLFYRVFRCFLAMGVQKHYKKRLTKKSCRQKIPNRFFLDFLLSRFWAFLGEGSSKTRLKNLPKKIWPTLVLFWPPRNQPTT
jgi:hypothetical protein